MAREKTANPAKATVFAMWRRSPSLTLVIWLFIFPAALAGLGLWQLQRGAETLEGAGAATVQLGQMLEELRQIAAENPDEPISFEGSAITYTATEAVTEVEGALGSYQTDLNVSRVRSPLAWGTIGGAVVCLVGAVLGLLASRVAGLRARRSRDQLIRSFQRLRVGLPVAMAVVVSGFSVAVVCATVFEAISLWFWDEVSGNALKLAGAGIVLAGLALYGAFTAILGLRQVFALFTPQPRDVLARMVTETEAPSLWRLVRELAGGQGALLPDTIISGLADGFYVTEGALRLLPEDRLLEGRTLYLPAPYLELLDTTEIAAIIGHELAHFAGEDTRYSRQFAPIYAGLFRALGALQATDAGALIVQPAARLGFHAVGQFDTAVAHWSRLREFEADRRGSIASGAPGAASALIRSSIAAPAVNLALGQVFANPDAAEENLVHAISRLVAREGLADPAEHLKDEQPHPTDSHPPTGQRIEALGVTLPSILAQATRPHNLETPSLGQRAFADWDAFSRVLSFDFIKEARHAHAQRRQALESAAAAVTEEEVVLYDNAKPMMWTMVVASAIFAVGGVSILVFADQIGFGRDAFAQTLIGAVAVFFTAAFLLYADLIHRRSDKPLMVLTPGHLSCPRLHQPIAWTDVVDYGVYATQRFAVQLALHEDAPLPKVQGFWIYTRVNRRRHLVTIDAFGIRGMKPAEFSDLLARYLHAAYARRELVPATA